MRKQMLLAIGGLVVASLVGVTQAQEISGEADYEATMKEVGSTFAALQQNMEARDGEQVISDAAKLAELFARVQAFWEGRSVEAAANFATTAHAAANAIRSAVENQEFQAIGDASDALGGACRSCHTEYREQVEGGGYRIKPGVL